ncbi:MAG TPA: hypothetical protein ENK53_03905 [Thiotrichales bacterium]|nr:hypothetical protein [Thiotrichales bacterium]
MIRLDLSTEPEWLDLGRGVRVRVLPPLSAIAAQVWQEMAEAGAFEDEAEIDAGVLEAKAWARRVIDAWEGVGDADGNVIGEPSPETLDALMDVPWVYLAFRALYLAPLHTLESEKNVSSPLPSGSSAGAGDTAKTAKASVKNAREN